MRQRSTWTCSTTSSTCSPRTAAASTVCCPAPRTGPATSSARSCLCRTGSRRALVADPHLHRTRRDPVRQRHDLAELVAGPVRGAGQHTVDAAAVLGEQVELVVEHVHVERCLINSHPGERERLVANDVAFLGGPWEDAVVPAGRLVAMAPLVWLGRGPASADRLPVAASPIQLFA